STAYPVSLHAALPIYRHRVEHVARIPWSSVGPVSNRFPRVCARCRSATDCPFRGDCRGRRPEMAGRIAFQGELGAYSHQACAQARPDSEPVPCQTFEDVVEMTRSGQVELGMLAVENSTYGRVADVHSLLPRAGLHIVDEAFVRVHVNLLGV